MRFVLFLALTAGCGGTPFILLDNTAGFDANPPPDAKGSDDAQFVQSDASDVLSRRGDALDPQDAAIEADGSARETEDASDAADVVANDSPVLRGSDGGEIDSDAIAAPEAAPPDVACTPPAAFTFGCGPPILVNAPNQYCVLNQTANTAQAMHNPCACEYDCACMVASGVRLCPGGEVFQNCVIGTTGGMVVTCK